MSQHDFEVSSGWIEKFKKVNIRNIIQKVIPGVCASVSTSDCKEWKQNVLNETFDEYTPKNIFNAKEMVFFLNIYKIKY